MDANLSAVVHTAKQLALLAETLERRAADAAATHERSAVAFHQTLTSITSGVENLLIATRQDVEQSTRDALGKVLAAQAMVIDEAIATGTNRIRSTIEDIDRSAGLACSTLGKQIRIVYAFLAGALVLLGVGGGGLILSEVTAYRAARARADAARIDAEIAEAYTRVGMTSCGGKPCVKLDTKSRRWGSRGEYVLVEMTGTRK